MIAVDEPAPPGDVAAANGTQPTDGTLVVFAPKEAADEWSRHLEGSMHPDGRSDPHAIIVKQNQESIYWRPGHALICGRNESREDLLAGLTDFAFYEGELRSLEGELKTLEARATPDVAFAHRIRRRHRRHWKRLNETMESLARMRLTFARLEPQFFVGSRSLPIEAQRWVSRLVDEADMETRLEAFSDRLEALEDLYEGANQRIADYRWYREGHLLEIGILVILVLECFLMSGDFYLHLHERRRATAVESN